MSVFRKRPKGFCSPPSDCLIVHSLEQVIESSENGVLTKEVIVPMTETEYLHKHPPIMEEFTLAQELAAGVSVKDVPSAGLLDSPDNLDYDINEIAEESILSSLEKDKE